MRHPGLSVDVRRRQRVRLAALRGAGWNRATAAARVRVQAIDALAGAAAALRRDRAEDELVRALVERALRRLSLAADLEDGAASNNGNRQ